MSNHGYDPAVSEPREIAADVSEVVPGVWHWHVHDDRIDFLSAAHAVVAQHTFLLEREGVVAFVPDLLARAPGGELMLVPDQYMHDPEEARRSVRKLLGLPFSVLCLSHGTPVTEDPHGAIRAALGE